MQKQDRKDDERRVPINLREAVQTFTAYLAIPLALFYPVGFFALWLQLQHEYAFRFVTAWYATTLIDRTAILGRGIWILAISLLGGVLFSWLVGRIFLWFKEPEGEDSNWYKPSRQKVLCVITLSCASLFAGALFALYGRMLRKGGLSIFDLHIYSSSAGSGLLRTPWPQASSRRR